VTIGIAVALHDSVLLVADGRRSDAYHVHTDQAEKVILLRDDVGLIVFGAEIGTDMAVSWISKPGALPNHASDVAKQVADFAFAAGGYLLQLIIPEQRTMPNLKVGLVAGGIDTDGPYLAAGLYGSLMERPDSALVRGAHGVPQRIVLGGEQANAQGHFDCAALEVLRALGEHAADSEVLLPQLLLAAQDTVRYAETQDRTIGGRIQYRILRRGLPSETGFR